MIESRAYYTDWSKSEREKQISCINACIWNLERWYWWTYLQGNSEDANIEDSLTDMESREEGEGETEGESIMEAYTLSYVK